MLQKKQTTLKRLSIAFIGILTPLGIVGIVSAQEEIPFDEVLNRLFNEVGVAWGLVIVLIVVGGILWLRSRNADSQRNLIATKSESYVQKEMFDLFKQSVEAQKKESDKSFEVVNKTNEKLEKEIGKLKDEITKLKQEKETDRLTFKEQLDKKDTLLDQLRTENKQLKERITALEAENKTVAQLKLALSTEQARYQELRQEFDSQKKQWNETFQAMYQREKAIQEDDIDVLDKTIPIPDTAEIDVIKDDNVTNSADDGTDNNEKDNAA